MNNFYKLYFKNSNGAYENAEIYENMKQAEIKIVDDIKTKTKVKAKVFSLEDKQIKRKQRKEEKRKLRKEMEEYIDR